MHLFIDITYLSFAIINVMADQFFDRPFAERFLVGFKGEEIVFCQILQAIKEPRKNNIYNFSTKLDAIV